MQIWVKTINPPPPIPWMTRPAISILMFTLNAQMSDPTKKTTFAVRIVGFLPKMSLILPHVGVAAAAASRYADPIQV